MAKKPGFFRDSGSTGTGWAYRNQSGAVARNVKGPHVNPVGHPAPVHVGDPGAARTSGGGLPARYLLGPQGTTQLVDAQINQGIAPYQAAQKQIDTMLQRNQTDSQRIMAAQTQGIQGLIGNSDQTSGELLNLAAQRASGDAAQQGADQAFLQRAFSSGSLGDVAKQGVAGAGAGVDAAAYAGDVQNAYGFGLGNQSQRDFLNRANVVATQQQGEYQRTNQRQATDANTQMLQAQALVKAQRPVLARNIIESDRDFWLKNLTATRAFNQSGIDNSLAQQGVDVQRSQVKASTKNAAAQAQGQTQQQLRQYRSQFAAAMQQAAVGQPVMQVDPTTGKPAQVLGPDGQPKYTGAPHPDWNSYYRAYVAAGVPSDVASWGATQRFPEYANAQRSGGYAFSPGTGAWVPNASKRKQMQRQGYKWDGTTNRWIDTKPKSRGGNPVVRTGGSPADTVTQRSGGTTTTTARA